MQFTLLFHSMRCHILLKATVWLRVYELYARDIQRKKGCKKTSIELFKTWKENYRKDDAIRSELIAIYKPLVWLNIICHVRHCTISMADIYTRLHNFRHFNIYISPFSFIIVTIRSCTRFCVCVPVYLCLIQVNVLKHLILLECRSMICKHCFCAGVFFY